MNWIVTYKLKNILPVGVAVVNVTFLVAPSYLMYPLTVELRPS